MTSSLGYMTINETDAKLPTIKYNEIMQQKITSKKAEDLISKLHNTIDEGKLEDDSNELLSSNMDTESAELINGSYVNKYYNEYTEKPPTQNIESELLSKVNYIIQLLEDHNDEKLNSVTEEMVLYCFLGVFMIFMIESFTKIGKYVRR
jgi:hypothetical protein